MSKASQPTALFILLAPELRARVHEYLLQWYATAGRDLPWRGTSDPYAVLVSEIMLQQTQVERVIPKYRQFLEAFPTLQDLADAPTAAVISAWVPLGYNRRAVNLQAIARQIVQEYAGRVPDTIEELIKLKGIGRYTAGAVACFAYRQQVATVDTNIRRVLHRVFFGLEYPRPMLNDAQMLTFAEHALPPGEAYNWNQALMDLGATICTSAAPRCEHCPIQAACRAYAEMGQHSLFPTGAVLRQVRKVAEKKANYQAQPFTSSNRYFRGRIIDLLRSQPPDSRISLAVLGTHIKQEFGDDDLPWLQQLVEGLAKDGLLDYAPEGVRLP
ncbi:MAG: A/G-specific adenine glycosylase [Ktedonobacteraceae bacterium]